MKASRLPEPRAPAREDPSFPLHPGAMVRVGIEDWVSPEMAGDLGGALHLVVVCPEDLERPSPAAYVAVVPLVLGTPLPAGWALMPVTQDAAVVGGLATFVHERWLARGQPMGSLDDAALDAARRSVRAEEVRALLGRRTFAEGSILASLAEATELVARRVPVAGASRFCVTVDTAAVQPDEPVIHESTDGLMGVNVQVGGSPGGLLVLHVSAIPRLEHVDDLGLPVTVRGPTDTGPCVATAEARASGSRWAFVALPLPAGAPATLSLGVGPLFRDAAAPEVL